MAETGVIVEGVEQLNRTLNALADDLEDLEPANRKAAELLLQRADAPRDSGALDASGSVEVDSAEGAVVYDAEYAGVIHNGWEERNISPQPWLEDAASQSIDTLTEVYVDHVGDLVHRVRGA